VISFHQPQKIQVEKSLIKMDDIVINYKEHTNFLGVWLDKKLK
jgi:hypothetical protein